MKNSLNNSIRSMWAIRCVLPMLACIMMVAPAAGQDADLRSEPGYLDLASIDGWFDQEPWLEVNVKGALLNLVTEASRGEDPELSTLLERLKAIEVRGYPLTPEQFDDIGRRTGELARHLEERGWDTIVRVREREERVNIYMKMNGDAIAGLVVMVLEPDDEEGAVFVNIVGEIDPEQIGKIGQKFNIDPLSDIK